MSQNWGLSPETRPKKVQLTVDLLSCIGDGRRESLHS